MRIASKFLTPWTPYSLMFTGDGKRLIVGGGSFYGRGGLVLANLTGDSRVCFDGSSLVGAPTISGVCLSGDDRYLAASSWTSRHHLGPTLLFRVFQDRVELEEKFKPPYTDSIGNLCPTGVLIHGNRVITRSNAALAADVVSYWEPRQLKGSTIEESSLHRTHSRMVVVRNEVITGGGGSLGIVEWRIDLGKRETGKSVDGMLSVSIGRTDPPRYTIPVKASSRTTAMGWSPVDGEFLSGGLDGELDRWSWDGSWKQVRLQEPARCMRQQLSDSVWATYKPASIVGISMLYCGEKWVSLSAGGELRLWERDHLISSWEIPELGSPRCVAAHPTKPEVAVGIKKLGEPCPEAVVVCIEVSN